MRKGITERIGRYLNVILISHIHPIWLGEANQVSQPARLPAASPASHVYSFDELIRRAEDEKLFLDSLGWAESEDVLNYSFIRFTLHCSSLLQP